MLCFKKWLELLILHNLEHLRRFKFRLFLYFFRWLIYINQSISLVDVNIYMKFRFVLHSLFNIGTLFIRTPRLKQVRTLQERTEPQMKIRITNF